MSNEKNQKPEIIQYLSVCHADYNKLQFVHLISCYHAKQIKQKQEILLRTTHFSAVFQFASDLWSFKCQSHESWTMCILGGFSFVCICWPRKSVVLAAQSCLHI